MGHSLLSQLNHYCYFKFKSVKKARENYKPRLMTNTGTAGVWRIAAINEAGGWKDRTTVEDMDLAVRASLKGWKFLYLGTVKVIHI